MAPSKVKLQNFIMTTSSHHCETICYLEINGNELKIVQRTLSRCSLLNYSTSLQRTNRCTRHFVIRDRTEKSSASARPVVCLDSPAKRGNIQVGRLALRSLFFLACSTCHYMDATSRSPSFLGEYWQKKYTIVQPYICVAMERNILLP